MPPTASQASGLRSGSGQRDARRALMAKPLASKPRPKLFHLMRRLIPHLNPCICTSDYQLPLLLRSYEVINGSWRYDCSASTVCPMVCRRTLFTCCKRSRPPIASRARSKHCLGVLSSQPGPLPELSFAGTTEDIHRAEAADRHNQVFRTRFPPRIRIVRPEASPPGTRS